MDSFRKPLCKACIIGVFVMSAYAVNGVIISASDGSGNTNAPADDPGWGRVGVKNNSFGSVVYLGKSWIMAPKHLSPPFDVVLESTVHAYESGTYVELTNYVGGTLDLVMFKVVPMPDLSEVVLFTNSLSMNSPVVVIGAGRDRATNITYWTSTWLETNEANADHSGYYWGANYTKRWGDNRISDKNVPVASGSNTSVCFAVTFSDSGPLVTSNECHAAAGDSGGGVFYKDGSVWKLAGIIVAVGGNYSGQPGSTAVYGNKTYCIDVSLYVDQIERHMALAITNEVALTNDSVQLYVHNVSRGATNYVQRRTDLLEGAWSNVASFVLTTNSSMVISDDLSNAWSRLYYRVKEVP